MKRKHFHLLIAFAMGVMGLILLHYAPTLTGHVEDYDPHRDDIQYTDGFEITYFDATYYDGVIDAEMDLLEKDGRNRELTLSYELFNIYGEIFEKGKMDVVLPAHKEKAYKISFKPKNFADKASFGVEVLDKYSGDVVYTSSLLRYASGITGGAVGVANSSFRVGSVFVIFVALLAFIFYLTKMAYSRVERKKLVSQLHEGRLIKLR